MKKYNEEGIRRDYWDLWHLCRKVKKKNPDRPTFLKWLKRTREALAEAGIDPGRDDFNSGNRGADVIFYCRHGRFRNRLCRRCQETPR